VIAISQAVRQACLDGGVPEENLRVVYSGVDPERLRGDYSMKGLREELGIDRKADVLLNVAALTDHKDHSCLLEAMLYVVRDAPRTHLLIAGKGELEDDLRAQTRELALENNVHFLGFCNNVGALLQLCDLFVMSSHLEGLCTAVIDAMAMERACVVTAAGGLPELVVDGETGRVVMPKDPEALAAAIVELLDNKKQCEKMGRKGRARVLQNFTIQQMIENTLAVYRELCSS
ncbi:MAG: glycosyltransferase family 4 protein, partial [Planctomycetes bacterium]|nr:glycosyltransferase family 4 protein [Planctomycetota bacterium]